MMSDLPLPGEWIARARAHTHVAGPPTNIEFEPHDRVANEVDDWDSGVLRICEELWHLAGTVGIAIADRPICHAHIIEEFGERNQRRTIPSRALLEIFGT